MGVQGLWELLAPVGRRVSVETLAGKKLAIDASIWMVQFIKAMRDERGEMVRNAHLLGFFRRICKLLFLRTKPVFVFDGATPALKRRTLIARRRQRENAQAKVRKTAEKLLLNHLKTMRLKELAENLQNQKQQRRQDVPKKNLPNHNKTADRTSGRNKGVTSSGGHEKLDGMLAASIMAEENGFFTSSSSCFPGAALAKEDSGEESILPLMNEVDPDVFSTLPSSIQHELLQKQKYKNDSKDKKILSDEINAVGSDSERMEVASTGANRQNLDEMLAASIAAEEAGSLNENASISAATNLDGKDTDDEDEEMILPEMDGVVDPSVLAALPPSVQLDLLVQMRERLMAENRQKYQRVKKDPAKFSELQIQAYLKTVAFRRDIDQVQKAASGRGVGGVQTSRIASEANREFIFSSSFTGDKQVLASTRAEKNRDEDLQAPRGQQPLSSLNNTEVASTSNGLARSTPDKTGVFEENVETFLDERGRVRLSRVRAMGMRMTRDLERNLDLMKEIEKNASANEVVNHEPVQNSEICSPKCFSSQSLGVDTPYEGVSESVKLSERSRGSMLDEDTAIEILLEDEGDKSFDGDDDLFTHLAAENPIQVTSFDMSSQKLSFDGTTDSGWEEAVEGKTYSPKNVEVDDPPFMEGRVSDESEVEWEDGVCDHVNPVPFGAAESGKSVSKGSLEEEADLQEAIRRSLKDVGDRKSCSVLSEHQKPEIVGKMLEQCTGVQNESVIGLKNVDGADGMSCLKANDSTGRKETTESSSQEKQCSESVVLLDTRTHTHTVTEKVDASYKDAAFSHKESNENDDTLKPLSRDAYGAVQVGDGINNEVTEPPCHMVEMEDIYTPEVDSSPKVVACENHQNFPADKHSSDLLLEVNDAQKPAVEVISNAEIEFTEDELTNSISILEQERLNLGDEQKRLERNAESVSSEMFAECQELLQMFGLPYIIAPMEAEAQCAYMELANLVDGVVTDDSDVFLFGARSVYKNIFDDRKYVETYFMKDVENELGLNRDKIIRMALLLGSDYTEGISGIGIVNAIEVMNAFPEEDGLQRFKEWIESPDPSILGTLGARTVLSSRKIGSRASEDTTCSNSSVGDGSASGEDMSKDLKEKIDVKQSFMKKHRNVSKNWHIPSEFPSETVISAYTCPQVDKSAESFSWGKPDHFVLRRLCWEKFGWDKSKADELLFPVLKEYSKHETQLRLEAFYTFNERFAKIRSKRIKKAVRGITGSKSAVLMDDTMQGVSVNKQRELSVEPQEKSEKCSSEIQGSCSNVDDGENRLGKPSRKRQLHGERSQPAKGQKLTMKEKGNRNRNEGSHKNGRGRGERKGRGRGRGRLQPKGKMKGSPITELAETSSSDDDSEFDDQKCDFVNFQEPQERRRSSQIRKSASYTMGDADQPSDYSGDRFSNDEAKEHNVVGDQSENTELDFESPKRSPQKDYFETGGGFCLVAEDEMNQDKDPSYEANNSEDYLIMGGGFCLDDDNECIDPDAHPGRATVSEGLQDCSEHDPDQSAFHPDKCTSPVENKEGTGARVDSPLNTGNPNRVSNPKSSQGDQGVQEEKDHSVSAFGGALSAMPNLRRKRRKY